MQNKEYIEEDEIDLFALFLTIWKYKYLIVIFVVLATCGSVIYSINQPNIYESKAVFMPTNDAAGNKNNSSLIPEDLEGFVTLSIGQNRGIYEVYTRLSKSFNFMKGFILKHELYKTFFDTKNYVYPFGLSASNDETEAFGKVGKKLTPEQEAAVYEIFKEISNNLTIQKDKKTNMVIFSYKSPDRFFNKNILDYYLNYSGEYLKNKEMKQLDDKIDTLKIEIEKLRNIELKNRMLELSGTLYKRKVFLQ